MPASGRSPQSTFNRRLVAPAHLLLPIVLIAITACFSRTPDPSELSSEERDELPGVWVLVPEIESDPDSLFFIAGDDGKAPVTFKFSVRVRACDPELSISTDGVTSHEYSNHEFCFDTGERLVQADVENLTVTGTLSITFGHLVELNRDGAYGVDSQYVPDHIESVPIGPLRFGTGTTLGQLTHEFEAPDADTFSDRTHRVFAQVVNCRLSNGTPCGNNQTVVRLGVFGPGNENRLATVVADGSNVADGSPEPVSPSTSSGFTALNPDEFGIGFGPLNEIVIDSSGATGSFNLEWWFESSPDVKFSVTGTLTGQRSGNELSGEFELNRTSAGFLADTLADPRGRGAWSATVSGDTASGVFVAARGGELQFVADLR